VWATLARALITLSSCVFEDWMRAPEKPSKLHRACGTLTCSFAMVFLISGLLLLIYCGGTTAFDVLRGLYKHHYPNFPYASCGPHPPGAQFKIFKIPGDVLVGVNGTCSSWPCYLLNGSIWKNCTVYDFWEYTKMHQPQYYESWVHPMPHLDPDWKFDL
jgi:hypothetical protein